MGGCTSEYRQYKCHLSITDKFPKIFGNVQRAKQYKEISLLNQI